jgi:hypothetical protein
MQWELLTIVAQHRSMFMVVVAIWDFSLFHCNLNRHGARCLQSLRGKILFSIFLLPFTWLRRCVGHVLAASTLRRSSSAVSILHRPRPEDRLCVAWGAYVLIFRWTRICTNIILCSLSAAADSGTYSCYRCFHCRW